MERSNTPVSMERMHHYWGFMSIHSSKYGKDASLLGLHVHTHPVSMERMHHYWGFMSSCPYTPVSMERMHHILVHILQ